MKGMEAMTQSALKTVLGIALAASTAIGGCAAFTNPPPNPQPVEVQTRTDPTTLTDPSRFRSRPAVNTTRNLYEGSLWRGAASWGNLLRDHRARYVGDLLTVNELGKIIKVPDAKAEPAKAAAAPEQPEKGKSNIDPVLAFLKEQEKRQGEIEAEQNEILRSVENVEVEVVRVLPNGNLMVRGVHPPIFRDRNRVKYIVTLKGIVRPSDVDDNNTINSTKLSKAEYKIQRLVKVSPLPALAGGVARAAGKPKEGALLDRLTDFATTPGANRTSQVQTK
jgi:flagellar L-ring protein precursor FlgH